MAMEPAYTIRRSQRAKRLRIVVRLDSVELVAPPDMPDQHIHAFARAQHDWIHQARQRVNARAQAHATKQPAPSYSEGSQIPFQGGHLQLQLKFLAIRQPRVALVEDERLCVELPQTLAEHNLSERVRELVLHWLKQQAHQHALELIAKHATRFALHPRSLRIKTQKSRWGSCGPNNDINLNSLLMLAPLPVFEYVVVHELCHIRHKNHSAAFWDLVKQHLPDYPQQRQWLKQHGHQLMRGL